MAATVSGEPPAPERLETDDNGETEEVPESSAEAQSDEEPASEPELEPGSEPELEPGSEPGRAPEETLPELEAEEREQRLERTAREFKNRRKLLLRNLPPDISNQDVHELLGEFDLKYCFVDKYKGTAFVTLLNGDQANSAIEKFHQSELREREISVQLQPTDALLCIANLPLSLGQQQFEELVRPFGNLERCFLVYSEATGHSKGYGFVEYMKKDFAARAKSELLGKQLGTRALYVHWTDVNQLTMDLLHSKCLCVDKLPHDYKDLEELTQAFSHLHQPVFCQLAQGPDGQLRGFAVLEYGTAEQAEDVQRGVDGLYLGGNHIRALFCAPGPPGRSMLPALIAAQATAMNRGKGLLPEPNPVQILNGLSNPATLRLLLNPLLPGGGSGRHQGGETRGGSPSSRMLGAGATMPLLGNPALSAALLRLVLQGQNQAQAQAQAQAQQKPGLLGESPLAALQHNSLGLTGHPLPGKGLLGESPSGSLAGLGAEMPIRQSQYVGDLLEPASGSRGGRSRQVTPPPITPAALQGIPTSILGSVISDLKRMRNRSQTAGETGSTSSGMSLLGEPPKDLRMPQNPYLNLHSVLPVSGGSGSQGGYNQSPGLLGDYPGSGQDYQDQGYAYDYEQYGYGQGYEEYDQEYQYEQYDQYDQEYQEYQYDQYEQYQQYQQYQQYEEQEVGEPLYQTEQTAAAYSAYSRAVTESSEAVASGYEEASPAVYTGSPTSYFTGSSRAGSRQGYTKANPGAGLLGAAPAGCMVKTPLIGHKRGASHLIPSPEPSPEEGYIGQHSQGLGGHYADSYLKRKRIF